MPRLKKKSTVQQLRRRKLYIRERLRSPSKREEHRVRLQQNQIQRLRSPTRRYEHRRRLQEAQKRRLLSPRKRSEHIKKSAHGQCQRLLSPTNREEHRRRLQQSQVRRLQSPTKRKEHRKRLQESQRRRLQNLSKRAEHIKKSAHGQSQRLLSPTKREEHRRRLQQSQLRRLQSPTKRMEHRKRLQESQRRRLQNPTKRAEHIKISAHGQSQRLLSPTKREEHRRRLQQSQVRRLQSPTKRKEHRKRLQESQRRRLQNLTKRAEHIKKSAHGQSQRLLSPTKREEHRRRLQQSQVRRLQSPTKRMEHRKRLQESQRRRLQNPTKRAEHIKRSEKGLIQRLQRPLWRVAYLQRLGENQRTRLTIKKNLHQHHIRLRLAQIRRLSNPSGRILHISRVTASKNKSVNESLIKRRKQIFNKYLLEKKEGPTYTCSSCHRLWFKSSVKHGKVKSLAVDTLIAACGLIEGDDVLLCTTCYNSLRKNRIPTYSLANKDLLFPNVPRELEILTELEERFLAPRIPFMSIRASVSDQQYLVKGRAVNVPTDVPTSVNILPRTFNDTLVIPICFRRKKSYKNNVSFENVRPKAIKEAAALLLHSPLYRHFKIDIDMARIDTPNVQVPYTHQLDNSMDVEDEDSEKDDDEPINVADDVTLLTSAIVFAPGEGRRPESLFAEYVEAQCFVKIYCGELKQKPTGMTLQNWIKSEIMRDDRRCATITKLFFSALKLRAEKVSSSISFCLRKAKSKQNFKAKDVVDGNKLNEIVLQDSGYRVFEVDRGSPSFWEKKKKELFAMMRQIGPPTLFLTLSPAETRWPELIVILKKIIDGQTLTMDAARTMAYQEKVRLVKTDPVTVARYFEYRTRRLFNLLKQTNSVFYEHNLVDFYIRTEFQQRGSPHLHCLLWLENAPIYKEGGENADVVQFIDRFASCSSLLPSDLLELQTHRHTFTCWKKNRKINYKICRFDIPFLPFTETHILEPLSGEDVSKETLKELKKMRSKIKEKLFEIHKTKMIVTMDELLNEFNINYSQYVQIARSGLKRVTIFLKREPHECMINSYNTDLLLLHEANMDIQYITDMYSCATYVINYLNKSNAGMSKLLREAESEIKQGNKSMRDKLRLLANCFLNASEFSAQEAVYYILALPLSTCSRQSEFINTNNQENRVAILKNQSVLKVLSPDSEDIFIKSSIDHYVARPLILEDVCLAEFVAFYNYSSRKSVKIHSKDSDYDSSDQDDFQGAFIELMDHSGYISRRKRAKIIRFVNYHENDTDNYLRENVMLFSHWRDEKAMVNEAANIFQQQLQQIKENKMKYVFNEDINNVILNIEKQQKNTDEESEDHDMEIPSNLMIFSELNSQAAALPDTDIDIAIANVNQPKRTGDDIALPVPKLITEDEYSKIISTLNIKQRTYLQHVLYQFKVNRLPFYHCVLGGAGVGKTRLIEAINQTIVRYLNNSSSSKNLESLKVLVCAPTGKAAFGISGTTLHSAFVLPLNQCGVEMKPLSSSTRNSLFSKLRDVGLLMIDEISMVGSRMMAQVNIRLREVFQSDTDFARIPMIVFGDFNQLRPVADRYIFESPTTGIYDLFIGNQMWDLFNSYTLTEIMRQRDDALFAEALTSLAQGTLNSAQVQLFRCRIVLPNEVPDEAIRLFRSNAEVDLYNQEVTSRDCNKVDVEAIDKVTGQPNLKTEERLLKAAKLATSNQCQGLPFRISLSLNTKYMISINVDVADGLVNGAVGVLKHIEQSGSNVHRVWLLFQEKNVGKIRRQEVRNTKDPSLIAIDRVNRTINPCKSPYSVVRNQLPLVQAEAITIYKSQGSTYDSVAVHLSKGLRRTELYVALSRCTKLRNLYLTGIFVPPSPPEKDNIVVQAVECLTRKTIELYGSYPSEAQSEFAILYQNIQSLKNKAHWADTLNFMNLHQPNIFIACETGTLPNDDISIKEYDTILRLDALKHKHQYGLVVYSKYGNIVSVLYYYENENLGSACCLAALLANGFGICTGYKPPSTPFSVVRNFVQAALDAALKHSLQVVVVGDFNLQPNAHANMFSFLEDQGFTNQLPINISTTNNNTSIDIIYSNFDHYATVVESFYSYHKQLLILPKIPPKSITRLTPPMAPKLLQVSKQPTPLATVTDEGKRLFSSLRSSNNVDEESIRLLLSFVRSGTFFFKGRPPQQKIKLPVSISKYFWAIPTTGDGNCFYYAVSRQLCSKETLCYGLRALIAHHIIINKHFLELLPLTLSLHTSTEAVLTDKNYAEILEVVMMSYLLKRPLNIYTGFNNTSMRFAPTAGRDMYLYLDMKNQHYTALITKGKRKPPLPAPVQNLPNFDLFLTY